MDLSNIDANDSGFSGSENIRPEYVLGLGGLEARLQRPVLVNWSCLGRKELGKDCLWRERETRSLTATKS
jgi:hypothetical protein